MSVRTVPAPDPGVLAFGTVGVSVAAAAPGDHVDPTEHVPDAWIQP